MTRTPRLQNRWLRIGLINDVGNLGGTIGPYFFGAERTATGGVSLILAILIAMPIGSRRGGR